MAGFSYNYKSTPHLTNEELACITGLICKGCNPHQRYARVAKFLSSCINWTDMERINDDSKLAAKILVDHFNKYDYTFEIKKMEK